MRSLIALYLSYLKTAALGMLWAAVAFAAYAFIRTSSVAGIAAAAAVALMVSMLVALPLIDCLSPSHALRRALATVLSALVALLRQEPRPGEKRQV